MKYEVGQEISVINPALHFFSNGRIIAVDDINKGYIIKFKDEKEAFLYEWEIAPILPEQIIHDVLDDIALIDELENGD